MSEVLEKTEQTRLRRAHERGRYDRQTIYDILDAQPMCHVGCVVDGKPTVMPTIQWREGDHLYWHASSAGRTLRAATDAHVCVTVSLLDGLVLARSGMHHSVNFRSVMVFGRPRLIDDDKEKQARLNAMIDALYPGRSETLRPMTAQELKATAVLSLPIEEASAKIRAAGVKDDEEDYDWPVWAGVVPVHTVLGAPIPDPRNLPNLAIPDHVGQIKLG